LSTTTAQTGLDQPDVSSGDGYLAENGAIDNPQIPGPLRDVGTSGVGGIGDEIEGFVEPSVAEVVVILDGGQRLDAVMTDGYFSVARARGRHHRDARRRRPGHLDLRLRHRRADREPLKPRR
jgi:hypothetical protein